MPAYIVNYLDADGAIISDRSIICVDDRQALAWADGFGARGTYSTIEVREGERLVRTSSAVSAVEPGADTPKSIPIVAGELGTNRKIAKRQEANQSRSQGGWLAMRRVWLRGTGVDHTDNHPSEKNVRRSPSFDLEADDA